MNKFPKLLPLLFLSFLGFGQSISKAELTAFSKKHLGIKYRYGMASPRSGFDCSGFIYYVFHYFNVPVPRTSREFARSGKVIHPDSCKPGDVIVFTGTNPKKRIPEHVGLILSKPGEDVRFIHSSSSKKKSGVKISSLKESPSYQKRLIKIVRVANVN